MNKFYVLAVFLAFGFLAFGLNALAQVPVSSEPLPVTETPKDIPVDTKVYTITETKEIEVFRGTQEELDKRIKRLEEDLNATQSQLEALRYGKKTIL